MEKANKKGPSKQIKPAKEMKSHKTVKGRKTSNLKKDFKTKAPELKKSARVAGHKKSAKALERKKKAIEAHKNKVQSRKNKLKPEQNLEMNYTENTENLSVLSQKIKDYFSSRTIVDYLCMAIALIMVVAFIVLGSIFFSSQLAGTRALNEFSEVGKQMDEIEVIGEAGLLAVADARNLEYYEFLEQEWAAEDSEAMEESEVIQEEVEATPEPVEETKTVVVMNLTSVQKDLKIKFLNNETKKLVKDVPFEIAITDPAGKTTNRTNDDKDGIIYLKNIAAGKYKVALLGPVNEEISFLSDPVTIQVKDVIEYKKIDVAAEIKTEKEVNAAKEDTAKKDTAQESALKDTVEWVESTKTLIDGNEEEIEFVEVNKKDIADPAQSASLKSDTINSLMVASKLSSVSRVKTASALKIKPIRDLELAKRQNLPEESEATFKQYMPEKSEATFKQYLSEKSEATFKQYIEELIGATDDSSEGAGNDEKQETPTETPKPAEEEENRTPQPTQEPTPTETPASDESAKATPTETPTYESEERPSSTETPTPTGTPSPEGGETPTPTPTSNREEAEEKAKNDTSSVLKTTDGDVLYVKDGDDYREAKFADYYEGDAVFYKKKVSADSGAYKYTGWQTIDGYKYFYDKDGNRVTGKQIIQGAEYTFGDDGRLNTGSGVLGIDVSKWNGSIDWNAVKNSGVTYVIIRCGYRGSTVGALIEDSMFKSNINGASSAGLKVGVYFFSQAINEVEAVEEASTVLNLIKGYNLSYPVFLDMEPSGGRADGLSVEERTKVAQAFCKTIQNSGYKAGIYANKNWFNEKLNTPSLSGYKIWLAHYAAEPSYTRTRFDMWQYSAKGTVNGISGKVDMNISHLAY